MSKQQINFPAMGAAEHPANKYTMRQDLCDKAAGQKKKQALFLMRRSADCLEQMTTTGQLRWLRDLLTELGKQAEEEHENGAADYLGLVANHIIHRVTEGHWLISDHD